LCCEYNRREYPRRPLGLGQFFNKTLYRIWKPLLVRTLSQLGWFSDSPAPRKCFGHNTLLETRYFLRFFFFFGLSCVNRKTENKIIQFLYHITFSPQIVLDSKYFESTSEELPNIIPDKSDKVRANRFEKFHTKTIF